MSRRIRKNVQAMTPYVPGEQPNDPAVIKLNTNENPYPPSPAVPQAVQQAAASLRLYPDPVCRSLCKAIGALHGVEPEQVIVGNGSDELLALCIRAFVEEDGTVGYFEPSYSLYPVLSEIEGAAVRPVPLHADFTWHMPADYASSLFFLTNPNAPTSMAFDKEHIRSFCAGFDGVVVIDEAYADFAPDHCLELVDEFDHVLVSRTLSKAYSLAGIRCGYAVGPRALIRALYKIKDSYNVNGLTQAIALAAIRDPAHLQATRARILATRERVARALAARGWQVCPSATNFLFARPAGAGAAEVFQHLRDHKVLVRYFPGEATGAYLRITIGTDAEMDAFLRAVDR